MNLDDFKQMDAEQKKKFLLLAIVGIAAIYAAFTFGVSPMINGHRRDASELESLTDKLDRAQRNIGREAQIRQELEATSAFLTQTRADHIPPLDNPLSWVARKVYRSAREVGVDIESVADLGVATVPWTRGDETTRAFVPYKVRIVTQCGYKELVDLVRALEEGNPYLSVAEIQVSAQDASYDEHRVRISVEWPFWADPAEAEDFVADEEVDHG
jgi:hypothetical protein